MTRYGTPLLLAIAGLFLAPSFALAQVSVLDNGSMELGAGPAAPDPKVADKWTIFGGGGPNVERNGTANVAPPGAGYSLKAFGDADHNFAGAYQEVTGISAGQNVTASVELFSPTGDKLSQTGAAGLVLEFVNIGNTTLQTQFVYPFDTNSPADTWVPAVLGPYTAPANTYKVRVSCRLKWTPGSILGAVYWDAAQLTVNGGANLLLNGNFETAGFGTGQSPIGLDFWNGFGDQEKSGDFAHDGSFSLKLGTRELYSGLYQDLATLAAGDHLYMTAYAYHPSTDPLTGSSVAGLKLEFLDSGPGAPPEEHLSFDANDPIANPQDTWVLVSYTTTVPAGMSIARVVMIADDTSSTNGPIYFDDASATRNGGGNQLLNNSFEDGTPTSLDFWTSFGGTGCTPIMDIDTYRLGFTSLRLGGNCTQGVWQEITVVPGEALVISAYLRSNSSDPFNDEAGPRAGVKVEWYSGTKPANIDIGGAHNTLRATDPTNTWKLLYIDFTMPAGMSAIARYTNIISKSTSLTGRAYIDSCTATVLNWTAFCHGDLNCDGSITFGDINPFVLYLSNFSAWQATYAACPPANGDINGDGTFPSFGDINPFVTLLSQQPPPTCP